MGFELPFFGKSNQQPAGNVEITDAVGAEVTDPNALEARGGIAAKALITALDKAVSMQSSTIENYVDWLRAKNPEATPEEIQVLMDKHFMRLATGSGAGAGAAAAIPGIGFVTGALAISAESLVFLDAAAFYTVAAGYLRGAEIRDPERRKALILVAITGSAGSALVDAALETSSITAISNMSKRNLVQVNNQLVRLALKQVNKRIRRAWLGKLMPMGVGLVLGTMANRKLADKVISNTRSSLGPLPARFATPAKAEEDVLEPAKN
ncbi:hypothetical protein [Corynebacterium kozikiae]|uniref:hypothetical protein n=1 Tax=Corynebacterium kozikiae TaxID=2968469 RepID=UPI00211BAD35|nr:hypothetical protein [Corynebacterium sp. 76QC2CO]MCQ9343357.1 hypothetical protein [Corynebacterium sp. 76QC2CO]